MKSSSSLNVPLPQSRVFLFFVLLVSSLLLGTAAITRTTSSNSSTFVKAEERATEQQHEERNEEKYFHEAGWTMEMSHYDGRYFKAVVPYEEHREVLQHLIRSYLSVTSSLGLETWLAHGTLLGWWWNGRIMPWDYDLDVQVSIATLDHMARNFNATFHEWNYVANETSGEQVTKTYLLDINPNYVEIERMQGQNVIDARWIDTATGMFVDITGLVERNARLSPGVWSCKNYHRYQTRDIWPLRETTFEGVEARIPYEFEEILIGEYGEKSLVVTEWEGHRWDEDQKEWVRIPNNDTESEQAL
ncbi:LicD family-domain-containing protein [Podospora australis]|uniref:LicD family-domain-containing protein n=1 Tax=Podospora australis TaxID=1536484 RepID=A0AAN7AG78_9PEZI|nr:LicD family-domain-containing protein [Podospora australis]